jgi:hypothetical protein
MFELDYFNQLARIHDMTVLYDLVSSLISKVDAMELKVGALMAAPVAAIDLTPVLTALADIKAQLEPSPVVPPAPPAA